MKRKRFKKVKPELPHEQFTYGPLQLLRFGNKAVMTTNWNEEEYKEFIAGLSEQYPIVVQEIDEIVNQIVSTISVLPPDQVLMRAYVELCLSSQNITVEADVTEEQTIALRMIDYIQSLIAATPRREIQKRELSDEDWYNLKQSVSALFRKLNSEYALCSSAHRKTTGSIYNDAMEEFLVRAQMHWCNVRGNYYQIHQVEVLSDLLRNQSKLIQNAYGLTSDELMGEIKKIWHSLTFGFSEATESMSKIHTQVMAEVARMENQKDAVYKYDSPMAMMNEIIRYLGHEDVLQQATNKVFGMDLFDICKITSLPKVFLDDFSWEPGQETNFLADGEFKGWPLRIQPIFSRPFLKLNNTYYCFDLYSLFDNFYRQIEKKIFQRSVVEKTEWISNRKEISENLPIKYFKRLLPGATILPEAYYPIVTESGSTKNHAEADCIIVYDDHLFIIEIKAGAFTYTSPANDLPAYINSLEALVGAPSKQGQRFLKYMESAEEVEIFDSKRLPVWKLRKGDFRCKTICAITLDPFTELSAQAHHLHKVGVDVGDTPTWPLSLADLRVYSDIFVSPLEFLHFVEQRMFASRSDILRLDDELDHLGLYLEHNNYVMHAESLSKGSTRMQFDGYRSTVDAYFSAKLKGSKELNLPTQAVPPRIREVIDFLTTQDKPHGSRIASYLLDFSGDWRSDLDRWIDSELAAIPQRGYCLPLSAVGDVRLTIFVYVEGITELKYDLAVEHSQAAIIASGEADRTLLELTYAVKGLTQVRMSTVSLDGLSSEHFAKLKEKAKNIKEKRLARSVANFGKLRRNELCPCGSGKKFKRCCMS